VIFSSLYQPLSFFPVLQYFFFIVQSILHSVHSTMPLSSISADVPLYLLDDVGTWRIGMQGNGMTSIEAPVGEINDVCVVRKSGLIFMALDSPRIPSFFIPSLGPAPRWCSFLENLTEELEEGGQTTIYDDYKFVTREDLERLNLTNMLGTNLLRAYMHGFFIDHRLYAKVPCS
jgi:hypothetical protein